MPAVQAMILAAGLGTRLLPHTTVLPKPLFPVAGKPVLFRVLDGLQPLRPAPVVVNCHHLRHLVRAALVDRPGIVLQEEEELLGTGGALARARQHFGGDCLVVTNADIVHDIDLAGLVVRHLRNDAPVSLVLHDQPPYNKVVVDDDGRVRSFDGGGPGCLAFTGIHLLDPRVLVRLPDTVPLDVIDFYRQLIAAGVPVQGLVVRGHHWCDIGTEAALLALHDRLAGDASAAWIDADAEVAADVVIDRWAVVGAGCRVGPGAVLRRCILLPGTQVAAGSVVEDRIVSPVG